MGHFYSSLPMAGWSGCRQSSQEILDPALQDESFSLPCQGLAYVIKSHDFSAVFWQGFVAFDLAERGLQLSVCFSANLFLWDLLRSGHLRFMLMHWELPVDTQQRAGPCLLFGRCSKSSQNVDSGSGESLLPSFALTVWISCKRIKAMYETAISPWPGKSLPFMSLSQNES